MLRTSTPVAVALGALGVLTGRWIMRVETHEYAYGPHPSQTVRLYLPTGSHLPVAVVIHGGYWRATYGMELAEPLGLDLTRFGVAAAVIEYRRVGEGGGWPTTLADAARAVDSLAGPGQQLAEGRLQLDRVAAVGHSAGGHLAAWLAHRGSLRAGTAGSVGPGESARPGRRRGDPGRAARPGVGRRRAARQRCGDRADGGRGAVAAAALPPCVAAGPGRRRRPGGVRARRRRRHRAAVASRSGTSRRRCGPATRRG